MREHSSNLLFPNFADPVQIADLWLFDLLLTSFKLIESLLFSVDW